MRAFACLWLLFYLSSCASYTDETQEVRDLYRAGKFERANQKIEESDLKENSRNKLLYLLEKGMITDRMNELSKSRKLLLDADKVADNLYTTSISKEALTYVYNDTAQDYPGEDYEKVAIHSILALSFLQDDDLKTARIEARKINTKLDQINGNYEDQKNRYSDDAFALYMSGSIYEALGEPDDAIIDYKKALIQYEGLYSKEFGTTVPQQLVNALYKLAKRRNRTNDIAMLEKNYKSILKKDGESGTTGDVLVIYEQGMISPKQAYDFFIPFGRQVIRLSFPIIRPKSHSMEFAANITVDGVQKRADAELVQNMDLIASKTLEDRRLRLVVKQGARLLVKGQITEQAHKNFGPIGGIAANIYSAVTETADTRAWTLLPSAFYATRLALAPGQRKVEIKLGSGDSVKKTIDVKPRSLTIIRTKQR